MRRYLFGATVATAGVLAAKYEERASLGSSTLGDSPALDTVLKAAADPAITRSVSFRPFEAYQDELGDDSELRNAEWIWRINVSDIAVPDADDSEDIQDPHVASAVYDFSWPGGGNISDAVNGASGSLCLSIALDYDFSVDVLNKYTDENGHSTDCRPFLGDECIQALKKDAFTMSSGGRCPAMDLSASPACVNSLGIRGTGTFPGDFPGAASVSMPLNHTDGHNGSTVPDWNSGDSFFIHMHEPLSGSRNRTYEVEANTLHIIMMTPHLDGRPGPGPGPRLMCMRINTTKLPNQDPNDDGIARLGENWFEAQSLGVPRGMGAWQCTAAALVSTLGVLVASIV